MNGSNATEGGKGPSKPADDSDAPKLLDDEESSRKLSFFSLFKYGLSLFLSAPTSW
jgi:hypothetical protein